MKKIMLLLVVAAVALSMAGCDKEEHPSAEKAVSEHPVDEHSE